MTAIHLQAEPLTKASFAPFGDVIEIDGVQPLSINQGWAERYHALSRIEIGEGQAILSVFRATARPMPLEIRMLERHPLGSQAFYPLAQHDWLIVVSAADKPDAGKLRLFRASGTQGVQYATNTWHHPLLILMPQQDFLIADRDGPGENLEECLFADGDVAYVEDTR
jgi:ureidoglycolate lyase